MGFGAGRVGQHFDQFADAVGAGPAYPGVGVAQRGQQRRRVAVGHVLGQRCDRRAPHPGIGVDQIRFQVGNRRLLERQNLGDAWRGRLEGIWPTQ